MVKLSDLTTNDTKNHEKNIGRGYAQINADVKGKRRKTFTAENAESTEEEGFTND